MSSATPTPASDSGPEPRNIHSVSRACTVPSWRWRIAPKLLKIAPWRMSVPTAYVGLKPKRITRIGVISEPPPMPVRPTIEPISRPVSVNCQVTLTGLLIGSIVGLTGMGGGSLMTPILVILFGFKPTYAVGTDILHGAIFKSFGAVRHRRLGNVHARLTFWMFLGSGPMSLLGVALASWLAGTYGDGVQSVEAYAIGVALILGGIGLIAKTLIKIGVQPDDSPFLLDRRDRVIAFAIGAVFGFVVGLTSVGSGTFFGLVMVLVYPLTA